MPPKKISRSFALNLQRLIAGEALNSSAFGNKRQLDKLVEDRAVVRMVTGHNRSSCKCLNAAMLQNYLRLHFGIRDLDAYIELLGQEQRDGEDSLLATVSTKALRQQGLQGFFIKAFSTDVRVGGVSLGALPDGVEYFVYKPEELDVSASALVVGVENPECFVKAGRLLDLFPQKELFFVLRYHSNSPVQWLETIDNHYLHFGDFDPAGISIYCNEYLSRLGETRCRFFVPSGVEALIKGGHPELFDRQEHQWPPSAEIQQPELLSLIASISRWGRGAEQEQLLLEYKR